MSIGSLRHQKRKEAFISIFVIPVTHQASGSTNNGDSTTSWIESIFDV
jgi:hypothetical protein